MKACKSNTSQFQGNGLVWKERAEGFSASFESIAPIPKEWTSCWKISPFQWNKPCSQRSGPKISQPFSANTVWPQNHTKCQMRTHTQDKVEKTKSLRRSWIKPGELQMQRESKLESRRKTYLQNHGSVWKGMGLMGSAVLIVPVSSQALEPLSIFYDHCVGKQNVYLKQIDYKLFLQQKKKTWGYLGSAENFNLGLTMYKSSQGKGRRMFLQRRKVGKSAVNCESRIFHWLSPSKERRGVLILPAGLC